MAQEVAHGTDVAHPIAIPISLVGIGLQRAVVEWARVDGKAGISEAVPVRVGARVARITDAVMVGIRLVGIQNVDAVVLGVGNTVPVPIIRCLRPRGGRRNYRPPRGRHEEEDAERNT